MWTLGYEFTHRFNDDWQFRQNSRYMQSRIQRNETWPGNLNNAGFGTTVGMTAYDRYNKSITYSLDNQLEGRFETGALQHTWLLGASFDRTSFNQDWSAGAGQPVNVFEPNWTREASAPFTVQDSQLDQQMTGLYSQMQSRYENWIFLLGGRFDSVDSQYRNHRDANSPVSNAESDLDYTDRDFTWQTGVMYQFDNGLSPYVSYSTSFVPVQQTSSTNGPLDPITAEQYEVGLKLSLIHI